MNTLRSITVCTFLALSGVPALAADNPLANFIAAYRARPHTADAPVAVSATAAVEKRQLVLKFRLTNISKGTLSFDPRELPWGHTYSIRWAAVTPDGEVLPLGYPIHDDFGMYEKVSVIPGETVQGTYELSWMLDPRKVPPNTELLIFWLYDMPARPFTGRVAKPSSICTGVAVVRTPKKGLQGA